MISSVIVLGFADQRAAIQRSRISLPVCLCEGIDEIDTECSRFLTFWLIEDRQRQGRKKTDVPCYAFNHTILVFAVHSNNALPSETFDSHQCKGAGRGWKSLGSPSSSSTFLLGWITLPIEGLLRAGKRIGRRLSRMIWVMVLWKVCSAL